MGFLDRLFGIKPTAPAEPAVEEVAEEIAEPAPAEEPVAEEPAVEEAAPMAEEEPAAPVIEEVAEEMVEEVAEEVAEDTTEAEETTPPWGDHLQKRLDTYFARLRQDFPDGQVSGLNTQHKKLAERGAELRRLIGYEGQLDEFFALGGFTYLRRTGGRPTLPASQTDSVEDRLRAQFPDDVPTVLAVQQTDHRLYLDLRAAARRAGCTVGEYLEQFKA